jgi:Domain of unknown function (DUF5668)
MNCVNHSDTPVEAFCQQCGTALCSQCVHSVAGVVLCEPCLAARLGVPSGANPAGAYPAAAIPASGPYSGDAKPGVAAVLGMIPGVGAMYNGQFIKALVHVLVFVILISVTNGNGIFGIFIGAWFFYQIFDAYQTAKARRDGLPLPDPFGLNDLGSRMGMHPAQTATMPPTPPGVPSPAYPPAGAAQAAYDPGAYQAASYAVPPEAPSAYGIPVPPMPPVPPIPPRRSEPVGAIILIGLGAMFLLSSMGVFNFGWIHHSWPIFLIALGGWLIFRRSQDVPNGGSK